MINIFGKIKTKATTIPIEKMFMIFLLIILLGFFFAFYFLINGGNNILIGKIYYWVTHPLDIIFGKQG